jgi:hypothetical protein
MPSSVAKILKNDSSGSIDLNSIIPTWLSCLPIRVDSEEMEPCYSLLLDLVAREHPLIAASNPQQCSTVLGILKHALTDATLPKELLDPLNIGLNAYLATAPSSIQQEWAARMSA